MNRYIHRVRYYSNYWVFFLDMMQIFKIKVDIHYFQHTSFSSLNNNKSFDNTFLHGHVPCYTCLLLIKATLLNVTFFHVFHKTLLRSGLATVMLSFSPKVKLGLSIPPLMLRVRSPTGKTNNTYHKYVYQKKNCTYNILKII